MLQSTDAAATLDLYTDACRIELISHLVGQKKGILIIHDWRHEGLAEIGSNSTAVLACL